MKNLRLPLVACLVFILSGCATLQEASTSLSCIFSRVTNSTDPSCQATPASSTSSGQAERFSQLQLALDQETQQAQNTLTQVIQLMQNLPVKQRSAAGPVQTKMVTITDSQSGQAHQMRAFSALTVDMPLAAKGRKEYTQAMNLLKALANELADNRGASRIVVLQSSDDVQAGRVNTTTGTSQSKGGKPVTVIKKIAPQLPVGVERYTFEAGDIQGKL